jgi:hypothetical protein
LQPLRDDPIMKDDAQTLIAYSREHQRVCPQPQRWQALWEMLPDRRQVDGGWSPPLPLILGAWHHASNIEKMQRLAEHLEWAEKHGKIAAIAAFIRSLDESEWHHLSD